MNEMEEEMTEYERKRLENMRRNQEMLSALRVQGVVEELRTVAKKPKKRPFPRVEKQAAEPTIIRRSLRTRGIAPDFDISELAESPPPAAAAAASASASAASESFPKEGPLLFSRSYMKRHEGDGYSAFFERLSDVADSTPLKDLRGRVEEKGTWTFKLKDFKMQDKDRLRVVPSRIFSLLFLPCRDRTIVLAGDKEGHLSFWDTDDSQEEGNSDHLFSIHSSPITGIAVAPFSVEKVFTCSYDGYIRRMDFEKEVFDVVYQKDSISAICFPFGNPQLLYCASSLGDLWMLDLRAGSSPLSYELHEKRINSIDFHPQNTDLVATASTDSTANIWDIRNMKKSRNSSIATVQHERAVHSAYFSPSGTYLATTSYDNKIGLLRELDTASTSMIYHEHPANRWISSFRAIWGWDDQHIFIGNMKRGLDVISTSTKMMSTFTSEFITAIPTRLARHPLKQGVLAGGTAGGQVYIWHQD